jgi:hypothetical protein
VKTNLHDDSVAHDESGNEQCVGLVEGIVERATAKHNSVGSSSNLSKDSRVMMERSFFIFQFLQCSEEIQTKKKKSQKQKEKSEAKKFLSFSLFSHLMVSSTYLMVRSTSFSESAFVLQIFSKNFSTSVQKQTRRLPPTSTTQQFDPFFLAGHSNIVPHEQFAL